MHKKESFFPSFDGKTIQPYNEGMSGQRPFQAYTRIYLPWILCATVLSVLGFVSLATSKAIRVDSDLMQDAPHVAMQVALSAGRFGLVWIKHILFLTRYDAWRSGVFFLLFLNLATQTLGYLFYKLAGTGREKERCFLPPVFMLLFATSPVWAAQVYFIWQEAEFACALFLASVAAVLMFRGISEKDAKRRALYFSCAALPLFLGIATYQTIALFYLAVSVAGWVLTLTREALREGQIRFPAKDLLLWMIHLAAVCALYFAVALLFFYDNASYQTGIFMWGEGSIGDNVLGIAGAVAKTLLCHEAFYVSAYPLCALLLAVLCAKGAFPAKVCLLLCLLLMLLPFSMNVLMGTALPQRMQLALPVAAAFVPAYAAALPVMRKGWRRAIRTAGLVFALLQVATCLLCLYTEHARIRQDEAYAREIATALQTHNPENKPVIFLGEHPLQTPFPLQGATEYAWSEFAQGLLSADGPDANRDVNTYIGRVTGMDISGGYTREDLEDACMRASAMPAFPEEGSVLRTPAYTVIKMSEWEKED